MKKTSPETKVSKSKKVSEVSKVNLSSIADRLEKIEIKDKKVRNTIYIYPDGWTQDKINSVEGKKFRNKLRNKIKFFCNQIFLFSKQISVNPKNEDSKKSLQNVVKEFKAFYKSFYKINDFSIESISQAKDEKTNDIKLMLDILKSLEK